jgi:fructose-1,6-bisphosphatase/inositol monophosphatase family enzyme
MVEASLNPCRFGSASMGLCLVADDQVDAFWEQG